MDSIYFEVAQLQKSILSVEKVGKENDIIYASPFLTYSLKPSEEWDIVDYVENSVEYKEHLKVLCKLHKEYLDSSTQNFLTVFNYGRLLNIDIKSDDKQIKDGTLIRFDSDVTGIIKSFQLIDDYINRQVQEKLMDEEIVNFGNDWTAKHHFFSSIHPFYTRESLNVFDITTLDTRTVRGDLYGSRIYPLNYSYRGLKNNTWKILRNSKAFIRTGFGLSRVGNSALFQQREVRTEEVVSNSNGQKVIIDSQDALISDHPYDYGFQFQALVDAYLFPSQSVVGAFASFTYNRNEFDSDTGIKDFETIPLRAGLLFNFRKNKNAKETLVLQIFADIQDLNRTTEELSDWRFGIGVGLPVDF